MALLDDFILRFPEITTEVANAQVPLVIPDLPLYYGVEYGVTDNDDRILLQLTAHLVTVNQLRGSKVSKEVTSRGAGPLSVSYNVTDATELSTFFNTTRYGQQYLLMIQRQNSGGFFV